MFRFRLDKVRRHRQRLVDREAQRLGEVELALQSVIRRGESLDRRMAELMREGAMERSGGDVQGWRRRADYLRALQQRRNALRGAERQAREAVAAQRRCLLEAHRQEKVLAKLEERQRASWDEEERRQERKRMDEVGVQRASAGPARRT